MDSEDQLLALFWKLFGTVAITVTLTVGACTIHENTRISSMVENGVSPLDVKCAFAQQNYFCQTRAAVGK